MTRHSQPETAGTGTDLALEHTSLQSCAPQQPLLAFVQAARLPDQTPLLPLHPCPCYCLLCQEGTLWWYAQPGRDLEDLEPQQYPPLVLPAVLFPSVLCQRCKPRLGAEPPGSPTAKHTTLRMSEACKCTACHNACHSATVPLHLTECRVLKCLTSACGDTEVCMALGASIQNSCEVHQVRFAQMGRRLYR